MTTYPGVKLLSTSGEWVDLEVESTAHNLVLFFYPGDGEGIRYAELRGCTAEACSFRDAIAQFRGLGARVYGVSLQSSERQQQFVVREHLPFDLLSDADRSLTTALSIPVWTNEQGEVFVSRCTIVVKRGGLISRVFSEVDVSRHVDEVLGVLRLF